MEDDNPYRDLPDCAFWRRAVSNVAPDVFDPVTDVPFTIGVNEKVATAGSCFAQHISRTLAAEGFKYVVTETAPQTRGAENENFGTFSARFGNIYTIRQLLQLFTRSYALWVPKDASWTRKDGAFVDPFRPQIQQCGFATVEELEEDRAVHLAAVREMFEDCDVFIFTLGLTEGWKSVLDGAVFPTAPGVIGSGNGKYAFENFPVWSMVEDLKAFLTKLKNVNPNVRVILTVSPVPLVATYEPRHVLLSTSYSKAALRVVAEIVTNAFENVSYFPSYEIITGPQARGQYYADDLREVTPSGVAHVMSIFKLHYLNKEKVKPNSVHGRQNRAAVQGKPRRAQLAENFEIVCDEEILDD
jgi:hypothetical protein